MPRTKFHPPKGEDGDKVKQPYSKAEANGNWNKERANRQAEELTYHETMKEELAEANKRLTEKNQSVSIRNSGSKLYLRATLPLKPGDTHPEGKDAKQYDLSLWGKGIPFNLDGIKLAEDEAEKLSWLMLHKEFSWIELYLGKKTVILEGEKPATIGELLTELEKRYFEKRKRNRQSEGTFNTHCQQLKRLQPYNDVPLSDKVLTEIITATESGSCTRYHFVTALSVFCNTFKYQFDFTGYKDGYKPKERAIPTDTQIVDAFNLFQPKSKAPQKYRDSWLGYQWVYGMLATYGLRPHEVFAVDFDKSFNPSNHNAIYLNETITEGIKTGSRWVFPIHAEWVELFDLKNPKPLILGETLKSKTQKISGHFQRHKIPFRPYDLRHAYAIRGHANDFPVKSMADYMGHSVDQHTTTYQKYMTFETRKEVYSKAINRAKEALAEKTEVELLREELARVKADNQRLMTDNQRLQQQVEQRDQRVEELDAELNECRKRC